jgi:hypothetical protein
MKRGKKVDYSKRICYWCTREWSICWLFMRGSADDFFKATPLWKVQGLVQLT